MLPTAIRSAELKHKKQFDGTQVVLKLKETQAHKRTPTHTKMSVSRDRLRSKRLCGFRRG